jgi:hypothetical protein
VSFTNPYCLKHLKDHLGFDVAAERKLLAARPGFKPRGPAQTRREP